MVNANRKRRRLPKFCPGPICINIEAYYGVIAVAFLQLIEEFEAVLNISPQLFKFKCNQVFSAKWPINAIYFCCSNVN